MYGNQKNNQDSYFKIGNNWGCVFRWLGLIFLICLIIFIGKIIAGDFAFTEDNNVILSFLVISVISIFIKPIMNFFKFLFSKREKSIVTPKEEETEKVAETNKADVTSDTIDETTLSTDNSTDDISDSIVDNIAPYYSVVNVVEDVEIGPYDPKRDLENYHYPTLDLLRKYEMGGKPFIDMEEQSTNKSRIVSVLQSYGVEVSSIKAIVGYTITLYEIGLAPGVRLSQIRNAEDDITLSLAARGIRIIAPIPGKGTIGIEMQNNNSGIVSMESVLNSKKFQETTMELPCAIGRSTTNEVFMFDLSKMPHLLVAGATGQGKSVGLHTVITSLIYKKHPAELKLVLIDPKGVEFNVYKQLENHFLACCSLDDPIITDANVASKTLQSLCNEMDSRLELLKKAQVRNIEEYNARFIMRRLDPVNGHKYLPYIVVVIDEYGELKMSGANDIENYITRLVKSARAVGIHLVIATCRPTSNILTSEVKANIPARIAFRVISRRDSQVILDCNGAEQLIGKGDMLFKNHMDLLRIQCANLSMDEIEQVVNYISQQQSYLYPYELPDIDSKAISVDDEVDMSHLDPLFEDAALLIVKEQLGSTNLLQRKFDIGYYRAGRLMNQIEKAGIVGPAKGSKPREVLIHDERTLNKILIAVKEEFPKSCTVFQKVSKYDDPEKQIVKFSSSINHVKDSEKNSTEPSEIKDKRNVPDMRDNIFGITESYFNNTKDAVNSLVSLYHEIQKDVTVMNIVDGSLPQSYGGKEHKLAALFHADVMKVYQHFGHSTANLRNKEGFALVLLSSKILGGDIPLNINYNTINYMDGLCNDVSVAFSGLSHMFDKYPDDKFFFLGQIFNRCRRDDLYVKYFNLLYRLFSIISKADNNITEREAKWLKLLMEFTHKDANERGCFNVDNESTNNLMSSDTKSSREGTTPIEELNKLIGLSNVKTEISSLSNLVKVQQVRKSRGMSVSNVSYHCVFTGNPGTGKTTVARIVAEIYKDLGVLKKGHLVETDRSGLIAEYVGQTAVKTNAIIDSALDGVLFIDEAYSLVQGGQGDYGKEAISTLLKRMEDDRDRLVVILAGYSKEMGDFINSNSGLQSRFNRYINFPDYSSDELIQIFKFILKKNDCTATDCAIEKVKEYVCDALEHKDQNFGNARFIRNFFEKALTEQANRLAAEPNITNEMLSTIEEIDVINSIQK